MMFPAKKGKLIYFDLLILNEGNLEFCSRRHLMISAEGVETSNEESLVLSGEGIIRKCCERNLGRADKGYLAIVKAKSIRRI